MEVIITELSLRKISEHMRSSRPQIVWSEKRIGDRRLENTNH